MSDALTEDPRVTRTRNDVLGAAVRILVEHGWDEVTHARVAKEAGYSRATVYAHWPDRIDLLREMPLVDTARCLTTSRPGTPAHGLARRSREFLQGNGDEYRLDRALATLAERAQMTPQVVAIRDSFVAEGERPMRATMPDLAARGSGRSLNPDAVRNGHALSLDARSSTGCCGTGCCC